MTANDDEEVESHRKAVAYFVSGSKARNGEEAGSLWAYDDSVIKVVSSEPVVPGNARGCVVRDISILAE